MLKRYKIGEIDMLYNNIAILDTTEIRTAYFLEAFGRRPEPMHIISFGKCNYSCVYCKRNGNFKRKDGSIIESNYYSLKDLIEIIDNKFKDFGRPRIRLSGGDPCMYPKESLLIAKYIKERYSKKISIAHNGSNPDFVKELAPYLEYMAIDYKPKDKEKFKRVTKTKAKGIDKKLIKILEIAKENNILTDIRIVVFNDTTEEELSSMIEDVKPFKDIVHVTLRRYHKTSNCTLLELNEKDFAKLGNRLRIKFPDIRIGLRTAWKSGLL